MLELSLRDCNLENRNIFVKKYERECFYELYPSSSPSDPNISVLLSFWNGIFYSMGQLILCAG